MKFLLDQNLSYRLVSVLSNAFPGSSHVRDFDLQRAGDPQIWEFAKERGFDILSKDSDFADLSVLFGHPPKVVLLNCGNCSTADIAELLNKRLADLIEFQKDESSACLFVL